MEAERNIRGKLPRVALLRFFQELARLTPQVEPEPSPEEIELHTHLLPPKDAPVLAAAVKDRASFLVTLDRHHFRSETMTQANLPITILTPGEFLAHARREAENP